MSGPAPRKSVSRLVWFVALYALSLGAFAALVYALRALVAH